MECKKHRKECLVVCTSCSSNDLICSQCLNEDHRGHDVSSFDDATKQAKTRIRELLTQNRKEIEELDAQLNLIDAGKEDQNDSFKTFISTMENRRRTLHNSVDQNVNEILKVAEMTRKQNCDFIDNQAVPVRKRKAEKLASQSELESVMNKTSGMELIQTVSKLTIEPSTSNTITLPEPIKPNQCIIHSTQIRALLDGTSSSSTYTANENECRGTIPFEGMSDTLCRGSDFVAMVKNKPFVECEFKHTETSNITIMEKQDSNKCWVKCKGETHIQLIDKTGNVDQIIAFDSEKIRGFCRGINGHLYLCSEKPNCIKQVILPQMKFKTFCHTEKLYPKGIASASSGDIFVILVESKNYEKSFRNIRQVVRYDKNGKEIVKVEKDNNNKDLFCQPFHIRICNETVAVLNDFNHEFGCLMLFDSKLNLKLTYLGNGEVLRGKQSFLQPRDGRKFLINDVSFNRENNIVISEWFSRSIQLLSPSCEVITTFCNENVAPFSLCFMADDELWVGYTDGHLKVWKV